MSNTGNVEIKRDFWQAHLDKPLILVGLMGAGKTSIGQALATEMGYDFVDSDDEIVTRAGMSISQIFDQKGQPWFRDLEREVIADLMQDTTPHVIGTGGGAFMNNQTRTVIKASGISIFLRADLEVLLQRVGNGKGRPLLEKEGPEVALRRLIDERYPIYGEANLTVDTYDEPLEETLGRVTQTLYNHIKPD